MNLPEPTTDPQRFQFELEGIAEKYKDYPYSTVHVMIESYKFACYKLLIEQAHVRSDALSELAKLDAPWIAGADADVADYNVKAPFLRSKGWDTWYNNNYWVHPKIAPKGADYTYYGWDTDRAYNYEMSLIKEAQRDG